MHTIRHTVRAKERQNALEILSSKIDELIKRITSLERISDLLCQLLSEKEKVRKESVGQSLRSLQEELWEDLQAREKPKSLPATVTPPTEEKGVGGREGENVSDRFSGRKK